MAKSLKLRKNYDINEIIITEPCVMIENISVKVDSCTNIVLEAPIIY